MLSTVCTPCPPACRSAPDQPTLTKVLFNGTGNKYSGVFLPLGFPDNGRDGRPRLPLARDELPRSLLLPNGADLPTSLCTLPAEINNYTLLATPVYPDAVTGGSLGRRRLLFNEKLVGQPIISLLPANYSVGLGEAGPNGTVSAWGRTVPVQVGCTATRLHQ